MVAQAGVLDRVLGVLSTLPSPQEVLAIYTTDAEDRRLEELAEIAKDRGLSISEKAEFEQYQMAAKYIRLAKAHALLKLKGLRA